MEGIVNSTFLFGGLENKSPQTSQMQTEPVDEAYHWLRTLNSGWVALIVKVKD